jgi:pilus assembly protein CpaC
MSLSIAFGRVSVQRGLSLLALLHLAMPLAAFADLSVGAAVPTTPMPITLNVPVGQSLVIRQANVKRVSAGDGEIVDLKVFDDTQDILVLGKKAGVTDLRVWTRDGANAVYLIDVSGPPQVLPPPPAGLQEKSTILIKAKLLEVKKSALRNVGIDWADVAAGPVFAAVDDFKTNSLFRVSPSGGNLEFPGGSIPLDVGSANHYLGLSTVVDSVINLLVNNGDARMLAEPTLTCINGGQAEFLVGGEVPLPVTDHNGIANVIFKQFGIILNVEPQANDSGLIRTKVAVEVSSIDKAITVLGFPGFATRKTNTEMNVQSGRTMVVAGLFSSEDAKTVVKVPGLGEIPILGELFKSREFRRGETELVVLVTPLVVDSSAPEVKESVEKFDSLKRKSDQALKFSIMD